MLKKKGQETALNATYLIVVIALLILAYILLLPESEKEKFGQPPGGPGLPQGQPPQARTGFKMLISESPGIIYPPIDQVFTKPLASVNLFATIESKLDTIANVITVSSNLLSSETKEVTFRIDDFKSVSSANLLLFAAESEGKLMIKLNSMEIFNDIPSTTNVPIPIPLNQLKQLNKLEFSGEKPSLLSSNRYVIRNVQLSLKLKRENNREARAFVVNKVELSSLQGITLSYVVNCFTVKENGRLLVRFNSRVISDNLIVCDAGEVSLDLAPQDILEGRNILEFEIDRGKYVLERVLVEGRTGQFKVPNYFFTLQVQDLQILDAGAHVFLEMQFRNDGLRKVGTIFINGIPIYIDTFDNRFDADITDFVTDGRNVLRILANVPFDVVNMNVVLG